MVSVAPAFGSRFGRPARPKRAVDDSVKPRGSHVKHESVVPYTTEEHVNSLPFCPPKKGWFRPEISLGCSPGEKMVRPESARRWGLFRPGGKFVAFSEREWWWWRGRWFPFRRRGLWSRSGQKEGSSIEPVVPAHAEKLVIPVHSEYEIVVVACIEPVVPAHAEE